MTKKVAYALHSVIEEIGNAPQHKSEKRIPSERELKRQYWLNRETTKNYTKDGKLTEKVARGKLVLKHRTAYERDINRLDNLIANKINGR